MLFIPLPWGLGSPSSFALEERHMGHVRWDLGREEHIRNTTTGVMRRGSQIFRRAAASLRLGVQKVVVSVWFSLWHKAFIERHSTSLELKCCVLTDLVDRCYVCTSVPLWNVCMLLKTTGILQQNVLLAKYSWVHHVYLRKSFKPSDK